jgi:hypothetical protein
MAEQLLQCPKDPRIAYRREVCEKIFRAGKFRVWCQACEKFKDVDPSTDEAGNRPELPRES